MPARMPSSRLWGVTEYEEYWRKGGREWRDENEAIVKDLVLRSTGCCMSSFVGQEFAEDADELLDLRRGKIKAEEECREWNWITAEEATPDQLREADEKSLFTEEEITYVLFENGHYLDCSSLETWEELCELCNYEPDREEPLQFWQITDSFAAEFLQEQGEMVRDVLGITIWARGTSGSSIWSDGVWLEMAAHKEILVGQSLSPWWQDQSRRYARKLAVQIDNCSFSRGGLSRDARLIWDEWFYIQQAMTTGQLNQRNKGS